MGAASVDLCIEPRRHGKARLAAFWCAERLARGLGGRAFYRALYLSPGRLVLRRERVPVPAPGGVEVHSGAGPASCLVGRRIVQLSDFHAGALFGKGSLAHAVELANAQDPDLAVLTGDFITHRWEQALGLLDELAGLRARLGVFAVFGNHDYRGRSEGRIAAAFAERGIRCLRNESVRFELRGAECDHGGRGPCALALVGVEDLEESRGADLSAARAAVLPDDVEIVLCHNPRGAGRLAGPLVAAVFCGHTHGTQVDLAFLRRLGPPHPGARVRIGPTRVITSRGLGAVGFPLRIGAPAEIVLVELVAAEEDPCTAA